MEKYDAIAVENTEIKDKMKPIVCQSCKDDGCAIGTCSKCMENRAYNREYIETHLFVYNTQLESYHSRYHDAIKSIPYRLPNEHPYLYYGIEVEVEFDSGEVYAGDPDYYDEEEDMACEHVIYDIVAEFIRRTKGLFVAERDSSLDNGVEFISRPLSYAAWTDPSTTQIIAEGFDYLRAHGALDIQPIHNGMHIHVSKKFFGHGELDYDAASRRFDWLFQKFQPEVEKLGRREYTSYCEGKKAKLEREMSRQYGHLANDYGAEVEVECKLKSGKTGVPYNDHNSAVNSDDKTLEARVFKSTVDPDKILANIEIVRAFAHAARGNTEGKTLNDILHTKDTLYLDKHIQNTKMWCKRNNKEPLNLDMVDDGVILANVTA